MNRGKLKSDVLELKSDILEFMKYCKENTLSIILIILFTLMTYGMKIFNYSISIDTEKLINEYDWQLDTWATFGRFGLVFTKKLFGLKPFNAYISCFMMVVAIVIFGITWSYVMSYFSFEKNKKSLINCVFPIIFITAPLFTEQFNFILQSFEVAFAIILCSIAVFFISKWTIKSNNNLYLIISIICMVWGFGTYQAIVALYISGALACYILIYIANKKGNVEIDKNYFKISVIKYLVTFIIGYVGYYIVDKIVAALYGASKYVYGMIKWGTEPAIESIKNILRYVRYGLFGDGLFYSKVFLVCVLVLGVYAIVNIFSKGKDKFLFLCATGVFIISPFLLSIYIGNGLIPRMQFNYQFVIATVLYLIIWMLKDKKAKGIIMIVALCIAMNQSYTVVRLFTSEQLKYEDDVKLAQEISEKIESLGLGEYPEYPVVLVGRHTSYIPDKVVGEFIGVSWFEFGGNSSRAIGFMKALGYNYIEATQEQISEGYEIAESMEAWPSTNSVQFKNGLIIVKLS